MIPALISVPDHEFDVLPEGIHEARMNEIRDSFAFNPRRRDLFNGLLRATQELRRAGCLRIFVDGSFVTSKPFPGDFDVCYELTGIDRLMLNPLFFDFRDGCAAQKREYGGEFFPVNEYVNGTSNHILDFFQGLRGTDAKKGIVVVTLQVGHRLE